MQAKACAPGAGAHNGPGRTPAAPGAAGSPPSRQSVIQPYITHNWKTGFGRDGNRPGGHANLGVVTALVADIIQNGALTDAESELLSVTTKYSTASAKAKYIKSNAIFSGHGFAICHKIPYSAFEKALLRLIKKSFKSGVSFYANAWNALEGLLNVLYATPNGNYNHCGNFKAAVNRFDHKAAVDEANELLKEFDKCDENLYVGFSMTNSSIGERIDLHFPILTTASDAVAATPRGVGLQQALNNFERALGLNPTGPHEYVDSSKVTWTATSSTYGKISTDTGFVQTT